MKQGSIPELALMHAKASPLLATDAASSLCSECCRIETPLLEFEVGAPHAGLMNHLLHHANGEFTVEELASSTGVPVVTVARLLEPLAEEGVILNSRAALDAESDPAFVDAFMAECRFLTRPIFSQPFWRRLMAGEAPADVVLGWGIEFTHFVDAANEYMAAGVAHCREDAVVREWFARHYVDEADHAAIFLQGLEDCGLDRQRVQQAPPLATTRALINHLTELAIEGAVPYAAAFGVMQPAQEPTDAAKVDSFYGDLTAHYGFAAPLFEAFRHHAMIDIGLCHEQTVFERLGLSGRITAADRHRALTAARSVVEHFVLFFEGINDYYGSGGAELPRRPVRMACT